MYESRIAAFQHRHRDVIMRRSCSHNLLHNRHYTCGGEGNEPLVESCTVDKCMFEAIQKCAYR